jgi:hypothetical protein
MSTYRIDYYEEESGFIYFEAENLKQAQELFEQVQNGEIFDEDLPNFFKKSRNGQNEFHSLEEVK